MKVLVLGGTVFLGRHVVEAALARGDDVTLFNRGRSNPSLYPDVERLVGDRDGGLDPLGGRTWDAVIDTSGYVPRIVKDSATLLSDTDHYTFVSSLSVYARTEAPGADETAPVGTLDDESVETVDGATYGPLKALCEQAADRALPGRVLNVRAGLIVGPHDPTDRFTYWPHRVAKGGDVLAPGKPSDPAQFIDARDLAEWMLRCAERRVTGVFNATGPAAGFTVGELLDCCAAVSGSGARLIWPGQEFLLERGVAPWSQLPVWVPDTPEYAGFMRTAIAKAVAAGLAFRPVDETVGDTLAWDRERGFPDMRAGLGEDREREVLDEWRRSTAPER